MFEPGLTKGMLEVFVAPSHHLLCSADDQSTKAIDIQNAYLNGKPHLPGGKELRFFFHGLQVLTQRQPLLSGICYTQGKSCADY